MQDKELDQLFKDRFESAELKPSRDLWSNISAELEPKAKKALPIYWMAAAVAVMVLGITLLRPETEKIRLQAPVANVAGNNLTEPVVVEQTSTPLEVADAKQEKSTPLVIAPRLTAEEIKKSLTVLQPKAVNEHPVAKEVRQEEVLANEPLASKEELMIASVDLSKTKQTEEQKDVEQPERRGIRNVGDLVNYVVDRVDKRDNKVLKFSTDDDDNSSLIAINIGFIRLNPKKHK